MTRDEFSKFAMALKTYYPRETLLPNKEAIELWYLQLQDIPYTVASASLNKWVALNKWSPSIADLRETASSIIGDESQGWGEAWAEVCRAITSFGHVRVKEALESLSPLTRKVTEQIGFYDLCICPVDEKPIMMANFRKIYEQVAEREKKNAQIPAVTKQLISQIQEEGDKWLLQDTKAKK